MDYPTQERNFEKNRKGIVIRISFVCGPPPYPSPLVVVFAVVVVDFGVVGVVVVVVAARRGQYLFSAIGGTPVRQ